MILLSKIESRKKIQNPYEYEYKPFLLNTYKINDFNQELDRLIKLKQPFHFDFLISGALNLGQTSFHQTAVQVSYDGVTVKLFSSDASLNSSNYADIARIAKHIMFGPEKSFIPRMSLIQYHMVGERQKSSVGCSIFALSDLSIMARKAKTILNSGVLTQPNELIYTFNNLQMMLTGILPVSSRMNFDDPRFFKYCQSRKVISERDKTGVISNKTKHTLEQFKKENSANIENIYCDFAFAKLLKKYLEKALELGENIFNSAKEKEGEQGAIDIFSKAIKSRNSWEDNNTAPSRRILELLINKETGEYREDEESWTKLKEMIDGAPLSRAVMVQEAVNVISAERIRDKLISLLPEEEQANIKTRDILEKLGREIELMLGNSSVEYDARPTRPVGRTSASISR